MSVAIVVPVKQGAALLPDCLTALTREASQVTDAAEIVVVDDGSTDGTCQVARHHGATVLRRVVSGGPYAARNDGWRSTDAMTLVFTDARCRPRRGWLSALRAELERDGVAIAGGEIVAPAGGVTAAARFVADRQALSPRHTLADPFLPYVPTATLAIRRSTLESVGGFRDVRSGGDVDLCWRVQLAGLGAVTVADGALSDWVPRATVREVLRQWRRYGRARAELLARFQAQGAQRPPDRRFTASTLQETRRLLHGLRTEPPRAWDIEVVERLCALAWELGYRERSRHLGENG